MLPDPGIEQCIAGARIETCRVRIVCRQNGYIGYPANVENDALYPGVAKQPLVKCGGKRCALPAKGDIGRTKVCDGGDACSGSDDGAITDLLRKRVLGVRLVTDGLAVTAYCVNRRSIDVRFVH